MPIFVNSLVGLVFITYFIQMYLMQGGFESGIKTLRNNLPDFFDRYRSIMLSYSFLRERIINNNSLDTYQPEFEYPQYLSSLDLLYNDLST